MGQPGNPNDFVALWWDDLVLAGTAGFAQSGIYGTAPNRVFVIEVRDLEHFSLTPRPEISWQLRLFEGPVGAFEASYNGVATAAESYSATTGWEGVGGLPFGGYGGCEAGGCDDASFNALVGRVFRVEGAQGPELTGSIGAFGRGAAPGDTVQVPVTIDNLGTENVAATQSRLLLSLDTQLDAADIPVATLTTGQIVAATSDAQTVAVTVPLGTPPGDYSLLLEVDSVQAITEPVEGNNVVAAPTTFATASDLTPATVVAPLSASLQGTVDLAVTVDSLGLPYTGGLAIEVIASRDTAFDVADVSLGQAPVTLNGLASEVVNVQATLPPGLTAGAYYLLARVDPDGLLGQYDLVNDVGAPDTPTAVGPDLSPIDVTVPVGVTPGQNATFVVRIANLAEPFVGSVNLTLLASFDPIYDLNDPVLTTQSVSLSGAPTEDVQLSLQVPALPPNIYFPIARVDSNSQLSEVNERNNNLVADTPFAVGPDLRIDLVTIPDQISAGGVVTVDTRILSAGAPLSGPVDYEVFVSEDEVLDATDVSLGRNVVTFNGEAQITDSQTVTVPVMSPGDNYSIIARVDALNAVNEANEADNIYLDEDAVDFGPDFDPRIDDFMPKPLTATDIINVTGYVDNRGGHFNGLLDVHLAVSRDSFFDPTDTVFFRGTLPISSTGRTPVNVSVNLTPFNFVPGTYTLFMIADPNNAYEERREDNNEDYDFTDLVITGPDVAAQSVSAVPRVYYGTQFTIDSQVSNPSAYPAAGIEVALVLASDGIFTRGIEVGRYTIPTLLPAATELTSTPVTVDIQTVPPGDYALGMILDPNNTISEGEEGNNILAANNRVLVGPPVPNLVGVIAETSSRAAPGDTLYITRNMFNNGVADAVDVELAYALSADGVFDANDVVFGHRRVSLAVASSEQHIDGVDVPANLNAGAYNLYLLIDPDNLQEEVNENDNVSRGPVVQIMPADLQIVSTELPLGLLQTPYLANLHAVGGGAGDVTWRLAQGALPSGLALATDGTISGVPLLEDLSTFTVEARRGSRTAEATLVINIFAEDGPLFVPSYALAPARVDTAYQAQLIAQGGRPPYQFTVASGLPAGLQVDLRGAISGVPAVVGSYTVVVDATDQDNSTVRGQVTLSVFDPRDAVRIDPILLPSATRGREYCDTRPIQMRAAGGDGSLQ